MWSGRGGFGLDLYLRRSRISGKGVCGDWWCTGSGVVSRGVSIYLGVWYPLDYLSNEGYLGCGGLRGIPHCGWNHRWVGKG